jgi:type I restriction enzyme S subunit
MAFKRSTVRLGYVASIRGGDSVVDHEAEPGVPVYGAGNLLGFTNRPNASAGEIVVGRVGSVGSLRLLSSEAWATDNTLVISLDLERVEPRFAIHALRQIPIAEITSGTAMPLVTGSKLLKQAVALPPLGEQRAIADYLDRDTARIDTLIEEQQRLIEMLRERRQAVIDASFSALGEPSVQLRRYIKFLTSGSRGWGDYYADQGERFLRIGNLPRTNLAIRGDIQLVWLPTDVTEGSRTRLQEGDLLFSITAYLGSVAVVEGDWVGAYVSQHVALCRLELDRVDPRFIGWFMLTTTGQDQLNEGAAGGTKMQLALDDIRGLRVPTAPIMQQRRIAVHLDRQTAKIDSLVAETERFIELSKERRAALITAVVTGQIDVREMA